MTSSIVDDGVMENLSDKDMMRVMLGEIDRLRERVRILEHIDKGNQSAVMALTKAAEKAHEDGEIALIACQYAVINEREECARLADYVSQDGEIREAVQIAALIRGRK